ncbi:MAG: hypothetical protein AAGD38_21205 [Acidobacteriota bacterium]
MTTTDRFRALAARAHARQHQLADGVDPSRAVGPGDLFRLEASAGYPIEWLLVDLRVGRSLAVIVDTHPERGDDITLGDADSSTGPLHARCAYAAWLPSAWFVTARRTGHVDDLDEIRARLATERPPGDVDSRDFASVLLEWFHDTVGPAFHAAAERSVATPPTQRAEAVVEAPTRLELRVRRWQWAAAALLVVTLGLLAQMWRSAPTIDTTTATLEPASSLVNLPIVWIDAPTVTRNDTPEIVTIDPEAEHVLLIVATPGAEPSRSYRLRIEDATSQTTRWTATDLRVTGLVELAVVVPASTLAPGAYRLVLEGFDSQGQSQSLTETSVEIRAER